MKFNILMNLKRVELLKRIKNQSYNKPMIQLSKKLFTYCACFNNIKLFEEVGLVITEENGREKYTHLTEKGEKILNELEKIK